jgi:hypothetical protein
VSNTYLVKNLSLNLLSVGQLCEFGLELHFSSKGCDVQDPQTCQLIGTSRKIRHLVELLSLYLPPQFMLLLHLSYTPINRFRGKSRIDNKLRSRLVKFTKFNLKETNIF